MESKFVAIAWRNLVVESDAIEFVKLRAEYGIQEDVVDILELASQELISKYENFSSRIDNRTYSLFLLVSGNHPYYKLRYRDLPSQEKDIIKRGDFDKAFIIKQHSDIGQEIKDIRNELGYTQEKFAALFGDHNKGNISQIENNKKYISDRAWTLLLLATNQHPNYYIVPNYKEKED